jgi:hypothetical protein
MKKELLIITFLLLTGTCFCACSSKTDETVPPTINQTVYGRDGNHVVIYLGGNTETISSSMEKIHTAWIRIQDGVLYISLNDGKEYRTAIEGVDGLKYFEVNSQYGDGGNLYVFSGSRILYKIRLVPAGSKRFTKKDLEKAFGRLTEVKI